MGKFLRTVFLVDLLQGLWVTFRNQNPKYICTEQYPSERPKVAERYRGAPRLNINPDNGETLCISCNLCALACPENLIVVTSERNETTKRKELTTGIVAGLIYWMIAGRTAGAWREPRPPLRPPPPLPSQSRPQA